jgi:hypothetical protein
MDSTLNLYASDNNYTRIWKVFISLCVLTSILKKTSVGSSYYGGIDSLIAISLHTIATNTVLDSLSA